MYSTSRHLEETIASAYTQLATISEERASAKPYGEKWSFKETLGHLIDSASNNHQRFVRMQEVSHIGTFRYSQDHWVNAQGYASEPWRDLVDFWFRYNRHLVHVIANVDPAALSHLCEVGDTQAATLELIITDYIRHVEHHLKQILSGVDPRSREHWT
ncbi:hypothetical protein ARNL5_02019 [Anaerolineae bacterium]|nr:hypothetical protein ARNL5_02019 [Anaerolineae bacterium]